MTSHQKVPTVWISDLVCAQPCQHHNSKSECNYDVRWKINPHMKVGQVDINLARREHQNLVQALQGQGAEVFRLPFVHGAFDCVFTKDSGISVQTSERFKTLLGRPKYCERSPEIGHRARYVKNRLGGQVKEMDCFLEGGDLLINDDASFGYLGYGFRSERGATYDIEDFLGIDITALELVDPHLYHLDVAMSLIHVPTSNSSLCYALAVRSAFSEESWSLLCDSPHLEGVIEVPREEALAFGLNLVELGQTVIAGQVQPTVSSILRQLGKTLIEVPLTQFHLAGGSAACLTSKLHCQSPVETTLTLPSSRVNIAAPARPSTAQAL